MNPRLFLVLAFLFIHVEFVYAQSTLNYTFSNTGNASLTDMSSGSEDLLIPTTTSGEFVSSVYPIGFDFWLMGSRYAHFSVNSNGLMRLGKVAVANTSVNSMATTSNLPLLTAFWDNLNSYSATSASRVRGKLTGVAPDRIFTVEWKDFIISNNSTSSSQLSTFQIRLYESSGVFEFVYGKMQIAAGSNTVTASIGMTNSNVNNGLIYLTSINSPSVQRTTEGAVNNLVNSAMVGNITSLHSVADGSRTQFTFTPVLPDANPSGLNFTAIGTSSMTLNWSCAATNELGFAIYRSDDGGLTYHFVSQSAANTTSSVQGALVPGNTYFWKVYAITEGGLSMPAAGSQVTMVCSGVPVTNTMSLTAAGTYNWNNASLWSLGTVPTACENAVITFTRTANAVSTATVNVNVPVTVNDLSINGVYGGSQTKVLKLLTNNYSLTVLGDLNISSSGGTGSGSSSNEVDFLAGTGSEVTIKGKTIIGQPSDSRVSFIGGVSGQSPEFHFYGDVTYSINSGNSSPGTYFFDGGLSQTITVNATTYAITFSNVEIGSVAATKLTLAGPLASNIYVTSGNLVVSGGSTLEIPYNAAFNQYTAGTGALVLKSNATLKLGDYFGGQVGSNFPVNFNNIIMDPASTVEYYFAGSYNPVIYTGVEYGNLILSNASRKYINANLYINGNFINNAGSTFGCDVGTYLFGPSMVNNGIIVGIYSNSRFGFYGNTAQTYSGTGTFGTAGTPFGNAGLDIYNASNVTLNAPIYPFRVNLFKGTFINSNQLKIGSTSFGLIQRGGDINSIAGSFDAFPVINSVNNLILRYDDAAATISTGYEIPASKNTHTVYSNNLNGVSLTGNLNVTNNVELSQNTFNLNANTVMIGNSISRLAGNMNGSAGTLEMNGSSAQTIPSGTFQANNLKNLIISNSNNTTGVTLGGALDIYRSVTFGIGGRILSTNGLMTLKSTATETAWLGKMTAANFIIGDATVERYIPLHSKAWQFLSTPITAGSTQTVKSAWQESAATANGNPVPGYGTQLTSNRPGAASQPSPGFDVYTASGSSIKIYHAATANYKGLNRTDSAISNPKGYMVLVRGDRSVITSGGSPTATTMRMKGTLHTPANPPVTINVSAGFESIGNPYASAIDFRSLSISGGVQTDFFYLWDPKLTTVGINSPYGLGGFQSFSWNGSSFDVTPGGGSFTGSHRNIESGQAFFVNAPFSAGTVAFTENSKISESNNVNRIGQSQTKQLRTNLSVIKDGIRVLLDGNLIQYNRGYSNEVDFNDGFKLNNSGENLGITRNDKTLVVERRGLIDQTDTVFFHLGQLKIQQYEFEFIAKGLSEPGMAAFLEDNFLQNSTQIELNDTSRVLFNVVNTPGSYAFDRFRLVFRKLKTVTIVPGNISEIAKNKYKPENVADKIDSSITTAGIYVFPNPVEDKTMHLQLNTLQEGNYMIQLTDKWGRLVYHKNIQLNKNESFRLIQLGDNIAAGSYQMVIKSKIGNKAIQQIIVL